MKEQKLIKYIQDRHNQCLKIKESGELSSKSGKAHVASCLFVYDDLLKFIDKFNLLNEESGSGVLKCHSDNPKDCKEVEYQIGCGNCSKFY